MSMLIVQSLILIPFCLYFSLLTTSVHASTRQFTLIIERKILPGYKKPQITVNGSVPGPNLRVTLGDNVEVQVINNIYDDATTIHWHGMTHRGTPWSDGIINITQCPISNVVGNNTFVYTYTPDRAGTFFYHGHYHEQQQDGLYGALIVLDNEETERQNTAANITYDTDSDEWTWIVSDWYAIPAGELLHNLLAVDSGGVDPVPDAFTVNNQFSEDYTIRNVNRSEVSRVRVIHAGTHSFFTVSVDGMPLTIIELDGVTVEPFVVPSVRVSVAQRVSFLLNWTLLSSEIDQSNSVWFRLRGDKSVYPQSTDEAPYFGLNGTVSGLPLNLEWKGLISFVDTVQQPSYDGSEPIAVDLPEVEDLNILQARPLMHSVAPDPKYFIDMTITFDTVNGMSRGYLNGATAHFSASQQPFTIAHPLLFEYLTEEGGPLLDPTIVDDNRITGSAVSPFVLPFNETVEITVTGCCGDHPFHLHGHHFWIIASSDNTEAEELYKDNYLVRDVVIVPNGGWVRIRFVSDNPGVWWFHCHLHWHLQMGLVATMIEAPQQLSDEVYYGTLAIPDIDLQACKAPIAVNYSSTLTPSAVPSRSPSFVLTRSPSTHKPTVSWDKTAIVTFQSMLVIDGFQRFVDDDESFAEQCVITAASECVNMSVNSVALVESNRRLSESTNQLHRLLVPLDVSTTVSKVVKFTASLSDYPQFTDPYTLYSHLADSLKQNAIAGNYTAFLRTQLLHKYDSDDVQSAVLVALTISAVKISFVTNEPTLQPTTENEIQSSNVRHLDSRTESLVVAVTAAGVIVFLVLVCERWKSPMNNNSKKKNEKVDCAGPSGSFGQTEHVIPVTIDVTASTTGEDSDNFHDTERGIASPLSTQQTCMSPDTARGSRSSSSKKYYVVERIQSVRRHSTTKDERGIDSDEESKSAKSDRQLSRSLRLVDSDDDDVSAVENMQSDSVNKNTSSVNVSDDEVWRLRYIG